MKKILLAMMFAMVAACSTPPPNVTNLYSDKPVAQDIPGSSSQALVSRVFEFSKDEAFEAAKKAVLRLGYYAQHSDEKIGKITGNGYYSCGGSTRTAISFAIYVEQISRKPETKVSVIVDRHSWECWGGGDRSAANKMMEETQKVLSTF